MADHDEPMRVRLIALAIAIVGMLTGCASGGARGTGPGDGATNDTAQTDAGNASAIVVDGTPVPPLAPGTAQRECHYEKVTGSHMMRKVCMTAAERRQMEEASRQWIRTGGRSGGVATVRDPADPRNKDENN